VISGFRCKVNEYCFLLGYCTVSNSNSLPTSQETISPVFEGLDLDAGKWDRWVIVKRGLGIASTHCIITQKNAALRLSVDHCVII